MLSSRAVDAQETTGLRAAALANASFTWVPRTIPGFRVYFLADSYAAQHQDSLLARLGPAETHARSLLNVPADAALLDVFFVESRAQMNQLIGMRATGWADVSTRTVFLVTNPEWRAFERHEIMHVVSGQAWGPSGPNTDWLKEGLAQAADGFCAGRSNADVALALAARHGWIPLQTVLTQFRAQPDLRAYLQAAAFVGYLHQQYGPAPLATLWRQGATDRTMVSGRRLEAIESEWRTHLLPTWTPTGAELDAIEANGCG